MSPHRDQMDWSKVSARVRRFPLYGGHTLVATLPPYNDLKTGNYGIIKGGKSEPK